VQRAASPVEEEEAEEGSFPVVVVVDAGGALLVEVVEDGGTDGPKVSMGRGGCCAAAGAEVVVGGATAPLVEDIGKENTDVVADGLDTGVLNEGRAAGARLKGKAGEAPRPEGCTVPLGVVGNAKLKPGTLPDGAEVECERERAVWCRAALPPRREEACAAIG